MDSSVFNYSLDSLSITLFIYQVLGKEEHTVDLELKADNGISKPEPEPEHHEIYITEDLGSQFPSSDTDSEFAAELEGGPSIQNYIPNRRELF